MDTYLPWFIIFALAYFAIYALGHRKAELTASDRRNIAFAAVAALIIPIVVIRYLYFR